MSSVGGRLSIPYMSPYHMSKWGLEALADALRIELRPWGIEVVMIEPGSIATPIWDKAQDTADELEAGWTPRAAISTARTIAALQAPRAGRGARGFRPSASPRSSRRR